MAILLVAASSDEKERVREKALSHPHSMVFDICQSKKKPIFHAHFPDISATYVRQQCWTEKTFGKMMNCPGIEQRLIQ